MSELINTRGGRDNFRSKLLAGVSAVAMAAYMLTAPLARAEDADHPVLWVELGGQFQFLNDPSETWIPVNLPPVIDHPVAGILSPTPSIGYDVDGKLTIQPTSSDWRFSVAAQYGRSRKGPKSAHDQTYETHGTVNHDKYVLATQAFTNLHSTKNTNHLIVDFQAGKDIGLGFFGRSGTSSLNFGIRMAQFSEKASGTMYAQTSVPQQYSRGEILNAELSAARSFNGLGPSVEWTGSTPVAGSLDTGLAFDWGVNAAVLFGRQKAKVRTHSEHRYYTGGYTYTYSASGATIFHYNTAVRTNVTHDTARRRTVVVPNIGALAGISYRVGGRGKIAFGYRADFFFGAMDGGIGAHKSENIGFHGPFATISLGLGG